MERWSDSQVVDAKEEKEGKVLCPGPAGPHPSGSFVFVLARVKPTLPHGCRSDLLFVPLLLSYCLPAMGMSSFTLGCPSIRCSLGSSSCRGKAFFCLFSCLWGFWASIVFWFRISFFFFVVVVCLFVFGLFVLFWVFLCVFVCWFIFAAFCGCFFCGFFSKGFFF